MTNVYKLFFILLLIVVISSCQTQKEDVITVIFDTDMESDVDDVGALAMLHALADNNEIKILSVISCAKNPWSIVCADRINNYFNRGDIPLGQLNKPGVDRESKYAQQIATEFPGSIESSNDAFDAVELYRKTLASQPDNSVTIITVGYLTNLRDLLSSNSDKYSKLSGRDLVKQKVRKWICMGGMFPEGREANIRWDTDASIEVVENWPSEIVFSGWEIGNLDTGDDIRNLPDSSPIKRAYELYGRIPHKSWDQVATLYAIKSYEGENSSSYWKLSELGRIVIDKNDGSNTWEDDENGSHRYLIQIGSDNDIASEINALMMHIPNQ